MLTCKGRYLIDNWQLMINNFVVQPVLEHENVCQMTNYQLAIVNYKLKAISLWRNSN